MQLIEEVAFRKLDQRLAALLLGKGRLLHTTHQQLADELGSVREIVSRLLKSFADQGLVRLAREQVEILDPAGLRRLSAEGSVQGLSRAGVHRTLPAPQAGRRPRGYVTRVTDRDRTSVIQSRHDLIPFKEDS